jgi:hypothetical protein
MASSPAVDLAERISITAENRRTLDQVFHHPIPHNLTWDAVVALVEHLGDVNECSNDNFVFKIGFKTHEAHKPHTHHLTAPDVVALRDFLSSCGWSPETHDNGPAPATT